MASITTSTNHDEIRRWAEERGGKPATVKGTGKGDEPGILRIDFPGYAGEEKLEHIEWHEFFQKFDEAGLAFVFQEETASGHKSRFGRFVRRTEEGYDDYDELEATGTPDEQYNLVSVLYHALQGAETYEEYAEDAEAAGDEELAEFFADLQDEERQRATRAKSLLISRIRRAA